MCSWATIVRLGVDTDLGTNSFGLEGRNVTLVRHWSETRAAVAAHAWCAIGNIEMQPAECHEVVRPS